MNSRHSQQNSSCNFEDKLALMTLKQISKLKFYIEKTFSRGRGLNNHLIFNVSSFQLPDRLAV